MSARDKTIILDQVENRTGANGKRSWRWGWGRKHYIVGGGQWQRCDGRSPTQETEEARGTGSIPEEEGKILAIAWASPEATAAATGRLDHRYAGLWRIRVDGISHQEGRAGETQEVQLVAGKEYHSKTTRPHQMWVRAPTSG
jgi:hypothetical protein